MRIQHVLVPLDQSMLAEAALAYAIDLVEPRGLLTLLTVVDSSRFAQRERYRMKDIKASNAALVTGMLSFVTTEDEQRAWEKAEEYLEQIAAQQTAALVIDKQVRGGDPADRILKFARQRKVDAIVMSTHGRSGISRWVMGSVAQKVVRAAACPAFLVPQRAVVEAGDERILRE